MTYYVTKMLFHYKNVSHVTLQNVMINTSLSQKFFILTKSTLNFVFGL